ncbi:MAG: hydantoinase B/oxoprolinase family protein [Proteobacteria bacterium]|nr:hydantoinase B/oxoprolinase family protein [Pseudomonadota bacterium]
MKKEGAVERIRHQAMWNRLLSVVQEQAHILVRTGFSTSTRESGDISAGVCEPKQGKLLAQAVTGTPGHVNSMAASVKHFIRRFPVATMRPGDVYVTNDPWLGAGHLHDVVVVTPVFRRRRVVALFACTCHVVDIGGHGMGPDGREIYHEGIQLPIMKLADRGKVNEELLRIIALNVREPIQVVGDFYSLIACNDVGGERLHEMMDEFGIETLDGLAEHIFTTSRETKLGAIRNLPFGTYRNSMRIDGYDDPVDLVCALTIAEDGITVDFTGTSPTSPSGINVPLCYTTAYASFGVNCVIAPHIPNNAGSMEVVRVIAPEGCILNAPRPRAVAARGVTGLMLPDVIFGCLDQAVPGGCPAEGASSLWILVLFSGFGRTDARHPYPAAATPFDTTLFHCGGAGARPTLDGLNATAFPSGLRSVPVEVVETVSPLVVWQREFRTDSGGAGAMRGGTGQTLRVGNREGAPFGLNAFFDRVHHPARGRAGGRPGGKGRITLASGGVLRGKGIQTVPPNDVLIVETAGGGGFGDPRRRDPAALARDVRNGMVSSEAARTEYGRAPGDDRESAPAAAGPDPG